MKGAAPVVENVYTALKAHDWAAMRKDFTDQMLKALPVSKLADVFGETETLYGAYVSHSFARTAKKDEWIMAFYTTKFAKGEVVMQFTFKQGDPAWKISGLFVRPGETGQRATKEAAEALMKTYKPIIDAYFAAYKARDFAGMEKDFSAKMKERLPVAQFKETTEKEIEGTFGALTAADFDRIETEAGFVQVFYLLKRAKGQTTLKFVFEKDDPAHKISGLWEKPL
jgi:hypothetical protein